MRIIAIRSLALAAVAAVSAPAYSYTFFDIGDAPFTPSEIDQSMTDYPTATGQHNSFYQGMASRWQSFTPSVNYVIGAAFMTTTATNGDTVPITSPHRFQFDLYQGEGVSGTLLGTRTVDGVWQGPKEGNVSWVYARFDTWITVVPGQLYTFKVTDLNPGTATAANRIQWSVRTTSYYAGGRNDANANWDYVFKVAGAPVPEPATFGLLALGLVPLIRRRKR